MRYSDFREAVVDVFGAGLGPVLVDEQVLERLGERTAAQALADGDEPRDVWRALCDALEVPSARRWGPDRPSR